MRIVVLYIAMCLDGHIAGEKGNVDTLIMGYKTYDQIVNVFTPGVWVYEDLMSYVFTHKSFL